MDLRYRQNCIKSSTSVLIVTSLHCFWGTGKQTICIYIVPSYEWTRCNSLARLPFLESKEIKLIFIFCFKLVWVCQFEWICCMLVYIVVLVKESENTGLLRMHCSCIFFEGIIFFKHYSDHKKLIYLLF